MPKLIDLNGQKFGRLIVKHRFKDQFTPNGHPYVRWVCKCDCGKEVMIKSIYLRNYLTQSCGCLNIEIRKKLNWQHPKTRRLPKGEAAFRRILKNYRQHSKKKNRKFLLTNEQAKELFKSNCFYCGNIPNSISKPAWDTGNFVYNGIDRVDNTKDYTLDNCVPCCIWCNRMKLNKSQREFLFHIEKISNYVNKHREQFSCLV